MSDIKFWKPVYQLFKPAEPLSKSEDLRDFYVARDGNTKPWIYNNQSPINYPT